MKDAPYFSHDANARNDPKMSALKLKYKASGIGMYWIFIEILREQENFKYFIDNDIIWESLADEFMTTPERAKNFIEECICKFKLLKTDGQYIWSDSLTKRMQKMIDSRVKRSAAGIKGMKNRWGNKSNTNNNIITELYQSVNSDITKDSKVKESKVKDNIQEDDEERAREGKLFKFYQENIGLITPHQSEIISQYLDDGVEVDLIIEVMAESLGKSDKWSWIKKVLNNCFDQNIKTLQQFEAKKIERTKPQNRSPTKSRADEKQEAIDRAREIAHKMLDDEEIK